MTSDDDHTAALAPCLWVLDLGADGVPLTQTLSWRGRSCARRRSGSPAARVALTPAGEAPPSRHGGRRRRADPGGSRLFNAGFPRTRFLSASATTSLLARLESVGIAGGSVYDALVGAVAAEHHLTLATRDRRALDTYHALDVKIELVA